MVDFKEKLLPLFKDDMDRTCAYLDYITSKEENNKEVYTE